MAPLATFVADVVLEARHAKTARTCVEPWADLVAGGRVDVRERLWQTRTFAFICFARCAFLLKALAFAFAW